LKIEEVAHIFGLLFPRLRLFINFDSTRVGPHLGLFFSPQAHLVTLLSSENQSIFRLCADRLKEKPIERVKSSFDSKQKSLGKKEFHSI
jgi:hypothetical protein